MIHRAFRTHTTFFNKTHKRNFSFSPFNVPKLYIGFNKQNKTDKIWNMLAIFQFYCKWTQRYRVQSNISCLCLIFKGIIYYHINISSTCSCFILLLLIKKRKEIFYCGVKCQSVLHFNIQPKEMIVCLLFFRHAYLHSASLFKMKHNYY